MNTITNFIIGTAGHVDHGKTALIGALTGIDTDRLPEEKQRGLTIDIGFAHLQLPGGATAGIIDVPGHERFVHNMLAGAAGVDLVLLVIAADEGVRPQTVEHLEILQLLEAKRGIVAITKKDLVDDEWLELVEEDIRDKLNGTFMQDAPFVAVSSMTKEGLDDLVQTIEKRCVDLELKDVTRPFRLPIDRAFVKPGFGTVVTGTAFTGLVHVGDEVEVVPQNVVARVRTIQVHGQSTESAAAGQRTAINLGGVEREDISRGDVICIPGSLLPTTRLDIQLSLLANTKRPLADGAPIRFHTGTTERVARAFFWDREKLEPGETGYAQLRFDAPLACAHGDRFVLRSYSPITTIGGGIIVEPYPKRRRRNPHAVELMERKASNDPLVAAEAMLEETNLGMTPKDIAIELHLDIEQAGEVANKLIETGRILHLGEGQLLSAEKVEAAKSALLGALETFHEKHPLREGIPKEQLKTQLSIRVDDAIFEALLNALGGEDKISVTREIVGLSSHNIELGDNAADLKQQMEDASQSAGLTPPTTNELLSRFGHDPELAREVLHMLLETGAVTRLQEMVFHRISIEAAQTAVANFIQRKGSITVAQFRDLTNTSRKFAVPLLEHLDRIGFTKRLGDERVLRGE